jgi:hypothetical protein
VQQFAELGRVEFDFADAPQCLSNQLCVFAEMAELDEVVIHFEVVLDCYLLQTCFEDGRHYFYCLWVDG